MVTGARLEPTDGRTGDCCRLNAEARADSAQQQPAKTIPAVAPDKSFRNSLRVGIIASLFLLLAVVQFCQRDISRSDLRSKKLTLLFHRVPERVSLCDNVRTTGTRAIDRSIR